MSVPNVAVAIVSSDDVTVMSPPLTFLFTVNVTGVGYVTVPLASDNTKFPSVFPCGPIFATVSVFVLVLYPALLASIDIEYWPAFVTFGIVFPLFTPSK